MPLWSVGSVQVLHQQDKRGDMMGRFNPIKSDVSDSQLNAILARLWKSMKYCCEIPYS